jgi:hypothetical protein
LVFEISHAGLKLTILLPFCLPSAEITDVYHHTWSSHNFIINILNVARCQRLTPVTISTQAAEIRKIVVLSQP